MESDWFSKRYGLKISDEEYQTHQKRLIFLALQKDEPLKERAPPFIDKPPIKFKRKRDIVFTPIPIPERENTTFEQLLEYDPYIQRLKEKLND